MANKEQAVKVVGDQGPMGWAMVAAYIGAVIYFYQQDPGFLGFFLAVVKAAVWPAYVVYHALLLMGA